MKRTVKQCLVDLNEYVERVLELVSQTDESRFSQDELLQDAMLRRIEVVGEIVKQIPLEYREKYPAVPWKDIAGTRDIISHHYDGVNMHRVWLIATRDIPDLKPLVVRLLAEEQNHLVSTKAA